MTNEQQQIIDSEQIGFIGLGAMGGAIARNLLKAGVRLTVFDLRAEAAQTLEKHGAVVASDLRALSGCSVVITCLPGPVQFESILFGDEGLSEGLAKGSLIVDMTSNDPDVLHRALDRLEPLGIDLIDAPVAGGKSGGEQGTLAIAVGGSERGFERARPLLEHASSLLLYAGGLGSGDVCKLAHNLGIHIVRQALAEMFTLGVKAGVTPEVLFEFVSHGAFGRLDQLHSWFKPRVMTGEFRTGEPGFRHALALKDIALVATLAERLEVPLPLGSECRELAQACTDKGWDDRDAWINFALQEERAGVQVRLPEFNQN